MKGRIILKGMTILFCMITASKWTMAKGGKPLPCIKIDYGVIIRMISDTTLPQKSKKPDDKKEEKTEGQTPVQVVKVIPQARRQPIPVPVKVNVQPVKIIKPRIIRPVVKPVINILH